MDGNAAIALVALLQPGAVLRVQFAGDQPIVLAQHRPHQFRRSGIDRKIGPVQGVQDIPVEGGGAERRAERPFDAPRLFTGPQGFGGREVVGAKAGMGVEYGEGRRLLQQALDDEHQGHVLEDFGVIAGVKGVSIIHLRV